jgi:hypothetical protein
VCVCVFYDARESLSRRDRLVIAALRISFFEFEREPRPSSFCEVCRNLEIFHRQKLHFATLLLLTLLCDALLRFCCCLSKSYSLTLSLSCSFERARACCFLFIIFTSPLLLRFFFFSLTLSRRLSSRRRRRRRRKLNRRGRAREASRR